MTFAYRGQTITIPAGKRIIRNGVPARQTRESVITVRDVRAERNKTRVYWKSNGYTNSALV